MKKLYITLIFSKSVVVKPLITTIALMYNLIVKFGKIFEIIKEYAGNRVYPRVLLSTLLSTGKCKIID